MYKINNTAKYLYNKQLQQPRIYETRNTTKNLYKTKYRKR